MTPRNPIRQRAWNWLLWSIAALPIWQEYEAKWPSKANPILSVRVRVVWFFGWRKINWQARRRSEMRSEK